MERKSRKPFVTADNVGRAHQVIVNCVRKVIGGNAVGLKEHVVNVVFRQLQIAFDQVGKADLVFNGAVRTEAKHERRAFFELGFDFLNGFVAPFCIFAIVAEVFLGGGLRFVDGGQLFFAAEARIRKSFFHQFFSKGVINFCSLALAIGAIVSLVTIFGSAFIKENMIVAKCIDQNLNCARDFALGVGVFNAKEEHTLALMRQSFADKAL